MAAWWDFYKLWQFAFTEDPISQKADREDDGGAGVTSPEAIDVLRGAHDGMSGAGKGFVNLHSSNEFVDISSVSNRQARYKEYERLRTVAEIETAMTIFADESCVAGDTPVATPFGPMTIEWLAEHRKDERFLVYAFDEEAGDITPAWAYDPRKVGRAKVCKVYFDDGSCLTSTYDHKVMLRDQKWTVAGALKYGDEMMAFNKVPANTNLTRRKTNQFPRIFSYTQGWTQERALIDRWKTGKVDVKREKAHKAVRMITEGFTVRQVAAHMGHEWKTIEGYINKMGFTQREIKWLSKKPDRRRVIGIQPAGEVDVYDLSVDKYKTFAAGGVIVHNCQKGDNNHVLTVECDNKEVKEEIEWFLFTQIKIDKKLWNWVKNLFVFGDWFGECVMNPDNPKDGIIKVQPLPPDSMFRIETTRSRLVEFQQSKEGPDYQALEKVDVTKATDQELQMSTALRFTPEQIIHIKINDDRKTFYPYGVSLIEPARGPAHQLRMMEDAMLVYRLTRAPERRVFYIDVGTMPPYRAEAFMERIKDQFRKKKTAGRTGNPGASLVEERWHAPSQEEDYWIPTRPGATTRIETLPGAQNLGEIDDALYFRKKLLVALNIPEGYMAGTESTTVQTRITLSAQDVKFARQIERHQSHVEDGIMELVERHLKLRGFPEETFDDLNIKLTPPSDWRELSRAEVMTNRLNNASTLKGSQLFSDYDIMIDVFKFPEDEVQHKLSRMKIQKLDEMKIQIMAQNPPLLGVGVPGDGDQDIASEPNGGNGEQEITPDDDQMAGLGGDDKGGGPPPGGPDAGAPPTPDASGGPPGGAPPGDKGTGGQPLPVPSEDDIKKYDLGIEDYNSEQDSEDIDYSEI